MREAEGQKLIRERRRAKRSLANYPGTAKWDLIGPTNIGGRITSAVTDPVEPNRIWVGSAGGGVFQSKDGGITWTALWHSQDSLNIGAMAIDHKNAKVLYAGTGEANLSADSYPGVGMYRSEDGGAKWKLVARASKGEVPSRIGVISIDPHDSKRILVGGVGHHFPGEVGVSGMGGIYESKDGAQTWKRLTFISAHEYRCHSIVFHPNTKGTIYATLTEQGTKNGIWRTKNNGKTWTHLTNGLPPSDHIERTSLAIAPSKPSVIYALMADESSGVLGVYRSSNGGNTWKAIHGNHFDEGQMNYGNTLAVHPKHPNRVICGGVDLHRTTNGGTKWSVITHWDKNIGDPDYAHADHHALVIPEGKPDRVYDLNDGGMDVSEDGGSNWSNRSEGLAVTMYYDLDVAQSNSDYFGGGAQDNGTPITTTGKPDDHFDITSGDGGWLVFDPNDENHIISSIYYMRIFRFPRNAQGGWKEITPPASKGEKDSVWMAFIAMDPNATKTLYTGSGRIWKTTDDGDSWKATSANYLDGSPITAIEVARSDSKRIYVGTQNGGIFRSSDGGENWTQNIRGANVPAHIITRIVSKPTNEKDVFVSVGHSGHSHVFRSTNSGDDWADVDSGALPDAACHSLAIPSSKPNTILVCGDAGVFGSTNNGTTWKNLTRNLPNVNVVDIVYHEQDKTLTAATYGRSIWRLKL